MPKLRAWIQSALHAEPCWFFRVRLLNSGPAEISKLLEGYEKDVVALKKGALTLSWYMRGGVSYEDVLNMSESERLAIQEIIDGNLEVTKKTQMPFF